VSKLRPEEERHGKALFRFYENLAISSKDVSYYVHPVGIERRKKIISMLSPSENDAICDLGCGDGEISACFVNKVEKICGVDISTTRAKRARVRGIDAICADAASTPFAPASFDKTICSEVIEHAVAPRKIMREIKRITKSQGSAVLTVPCNERLQKTLKDVPEKDLAQMSLVEIGQKHNVTCAHLHSFSECTFVEMLKEEGFEIKQIEFTHSYDSRFGRLILPIVFVLMFIKRLHIESRALDNIVSILYKKKNDKKNHIIVETEKP
jgi:ubiquinone/menaquinone biosynthesis C-methylase UbiE